MSAGESPQPQGRSYEMLLQSILDGQTETFRRMEQLRETMATKEDLNTLREDLGKTVSLDVLNARLETERQARESLAVELATIKQDVVKMQRNGLPEWVWPALGVIAVFLVPIISIFLPSHVQLTLK